MTKDFASVIFIAIAVLSLGSQFSGAQQPAALLVDTPPNIDESAVVQFPSLQKSATSIAAQAWRSVGPAPASYYDYRSVSGRISSIAVDTVDARILYIAAATGGVWKTSDGGSTWTPLTDALPRLSSGVVAIDPSDHNTIYYGTGEAHYSIDSYPGAGVFKSTDGGVSWMQVNDSLRYTSRILIDPVSPSTIYIAGYPGIYSLPMQDKRGFELTIATVNRLATVQSLAFDPTAPATLYACVGSLWNTGARSDTGIFKSTDAGVNWQKLAGGLPTGEYITRGEIAVAPSNPQILYLGLWGKNPRSGGNDTTRIFKSTDGGQSWTPLPGAPNYGGGQGWYNNVIAVSPADPGIVYAGGIDLWRSTDGGTNWDNLTNGTVHVDQHAIAFARGNPDIFDLGNDGGIWKYANGRFQNLNTNLAITQFYTVGIDPQRPEFSYGGTQDNGTLKNVQPSLTWNAIYGGDGGVVIVDPSDTNVIYAEYVYGDIVKTTDGGKHWIHVTTGLEKGYWITPLVMDPKSHQVLYTGMSKVFKTTNGGGSWTPISPQLVSGRLITTLSISPVNPQVIYAGLSGYRGSYPSYLFVTTDGGEHWIDVSNNLPDRYLVRVLADPKIPGRVYATNIVSSSSVSAPVHIMRSEDHGLTWKIITSNFPDIPTKCILIDSLTNFIYAGTYQGVYRSTDDGASWQAFNDQLPNAIVDDMAMNYTTHTLRIGTHGRSAFECTLTSSASDEHKGLPDQVALLQSYPNPVSVGGIYSAMDSRNTGSIITIQFTLPTDISASLRIFDILGREVSVPGAPLNGTFKRGSHSVPVDVSSLSPGVYFYQLRTNDSVVSRKFVVLR